ncbi:helix-turn-helix transcriptional regulator [Rhodococcoides kyotonense]|uniref:Regulatory protein, luxR family n=1 Tax=Rhodococcoides kyotonense TaxID=398843 RepID=A0A239JZK8_9NOCA|nr:LuxR C-terminal-related transcriptional regulator [Rhodococcus kyotonensis]SNT11221.1 regulatory protein, luxR family [Rhodococcus kyotonensis]
MRSAASSVTPTARTSAHDLFGRVRDVLGGSDELTRIEQGGSDVVSLRRFLVERLRATVFDRSEIEAIARILVRIDAHQCETVSAQIEKCAAQFAALRTVADAIGAAQPDDLAHTVTTSLCGPLGYRKAMFSVVNGSSWSPASVSMQPDLAPMFADLVSAVDGHGIELRDAPREAELVRKRRPYVLDRVDTYRYTYRPLIDLSRPSGYLAVPIVVGGRARGIIHVDRHEEGLTDSDMHMVGALAAVCTLSSERADLRGSLRARRTDMETRIAQLARALRELDASSVGFASAADEQNGQVGRESGPVSRAGPPAELTHREWEVLELLAAGETNSSISHALCISDGTVKSHVQRIFRKIHVSTRAEAAAFVARRRSRPRNADGR